MPSLVFALGARGRQREETIPLLIRVRCADRGRLPASTVWGARHALATSRSLADGRSVKDAIDADPTAIGAVSEFKGDTDIKNRHVNILLRYGRLPQTMLAVSRIMTGI